MKRRYVPMEDRTYVPMADPELASLMAAVRYPERCPVGHGPDSDGVLVATTRAGVGRLVGRWRCRHCTQTLSIDGEYLRAVGLELTDLPIASWKFAYADQPHHWPKTERVRRRRPLRAKGTPWPSR